MRSSVVAIAVIAVSMVAAGDAAAASKLCPNTYGGDVISATNVACQRARQVVRTWGKRYKADRKATRTVLGYRCKGRNDQYEGLTIRCTKRKASIRFYANVP